MESLNDSASESSGAEHDRVRDRLWGSRHRWVNLQMPDHQLDRITVQADRGGVLPWMDSGEQ